MQSLRLCRVLIMGCYSVLSMGCYEVFATILLMLFNLLINHFSRKEQKTQLHLLPHHGVLLHDLPLHIFEDILRRLPPKTLFQCTCVSKLWYSVIKDPLFTKQLSLKHQRNQKLVFLFGAARVFSLDYEASVPKLVDIYHSSSKLHKECNPTRYSDGVRIWGSCAGLLCISSFDSEAVYLWNPCTHEYKRIPDTPKHPRDDWFWDRCHSMYMLGYDAATQDHIVVRVYNYMYSGRRKYSPHLNSHSEVEVYSSRKNSWRRMRDIPYVIMHLEFGRFINGSFYWVAQHNSQLVIVSYHVETDKIVEVPLPDDVDRSYDHITVASVDGYLCAIFHYMTASEGWMMSSHARKSWKIGFRVPNWNTVPLSFMHNRKELLLVDKQLGLYWLDNKGGTRKLEFQNCPAEFQNHRHLIFYPTVYTESSVSLCS